MSTVPNRNASGISKLAVVVLLALVLAGCFLTLALYVSWQRQAEPSLLTSLQTPLWSVPQFELTNCDGRAVSSSDLLGKVWVASFVFTRCAGPCPLITQQMRHIQRALSGSEEVALVSFTVDPAFDRPGVLLDYARNWKADLDNWFFLTHAEPEEMLRIAREFKIAAYYQPSEGGDSAELVHGTKLLLIDRRGQVRGLFDSDHPGVRDKIVEGIGKLLAEGSAATGS